MGSVRAIGLDVQAAGIANIIPVHVPSPERRVDRATVDAQPVALVTTRRLAARLVGARAIGCSIAWVQNLLALMVCVLVLLMRRLVELLVVM